jgi:hypothetical protein
MKCNKCKKTQKQRNLEPPAKTGINHPVYCRTKSFYKYAEDVYLCPECHREKQLELVMASMDNYAKKFGEKALARKCGLK